MIVAFYAELIRSQNLRFWDMQLLFYDHGGESFSEKEKGELWLKIVHILLL